MPFKSKAEMRKWAELVDQGKVTPKQNQERLKKTKDPRKLPDRIHPKTPTSVDELRSIQKQFGKKR